jgi:precorrin-2/cobalt-factor-2 C20-methyltransferase
MSGIITSGETATVNGAASATGTVYGLGVGPGDPELITLKALRLLRSVSVVAYPVQGDGVSIARAIVAGQIPDGVHEVQIETPMGSRALATQGYRKAAAELAIELDAGRDVAVLCEGDPLLYGTFGYLFELLAERYPVQVVPGVCSPTAAAAAAAVPLAQGAETLAVLPGTLPDARLRPLLVAVQSAAIMKVGRHLERIRQLLDELGLGNGALYVERASQRGQRVLPLAAVDPATATYFSTILVRREAPARREGEAR